MRLLGGETKYQEAKYTSYAFGPALYTKPFRFLPGIALGPIGLIDDAAVLVFVYKRITGELERFRRRRSIKMRR